MVDIKVCARCKATKPATEEHFGSGGKKSAFHSYCRVCYREWRRDWRWANPEREAAKKKAWAARNPDAVKAIRRRRVVVKHGITEADYQMLLAEQCGKCAICDRNQNHALTARLFIDHDHETGEVRGLLCSNCNNGLGHFKDDPRRLEAAAAYLRKGTTQ